MLLVNNQERLNQFNQLFCVVKSQTEEIDLCLKNYTDIRECNSTLTRTSYRVYALYNDALIKKYGLLDDLLGDITDGVYDPVSPNFGKTISFRYELQTAYAWTEIHNLTSHLCYHLGAVNYLQKFRYNEEWFENKDRMLCFSNNERTWFIYDSYEDIWYRLQGENQSLTSLIQQNKIVKFEEIDENDESLTEMIQQLEDEFLN